MKLMLLLAVILAPCLRAETYRGVATTRGPGTQHSIELVLTYEHIPAKKPDQEFPPRYSAKVAIRHEPGRGSFQEYDFVITQAPDRKEWSLIGYFLIPHFRGSIPLVLRVDTWNKERPFYLFDPDHPERIYVGKFE